MGIKAPYPPSPYSPKAPYDNRKALHQRNGCSNNMEWAHRLIPETYSLLMQKNAA